jgi:hypothetical protein
MRMNDFYKGKKNIKTKSTTEEIEQLQEVSGILSNALDYINKLIAVKTLNNKMKKETK